MNRMTQPAFEPIDSRTENCGRVRTVRTSKTPIKAPANFQSLAPRGSDPDDDPLCTKWAGSGIASDLKCEQCGNQQKNRQIFCNAGLSYPNGNSWNDWEVVCGACGVFSYVCTFSEG